MNRGFHELEPLRGLRGALGDNRSQVCEPREGQLKKKGRAVYAQDDHATRGIPAVSDYPQFLCITLWVTAPQGRSGRTKAA
jgi:hypothetical protein